MKIFGKILLVLLLLIILVPVFILGFLGYIPGLSSILGADKPRDLGIKFSETDKTSARAKSQIVYETLPSETPPEKSIQRSGTRSVNFEFSSAEASSLMNNRPWKYWPYEHVQVRFNADGSAEVSGNLIKDRLPGYAAAIGVPKEVLDVAVKFLPPHPVFYLKMAASLKDNKVDVFTPQAFHIGKISLPVSVFLSFVPPQIIPTVFAADGDLTSELAKVNNKRALIIDYINNRLGKLGGFFANRAYFADNKLHFDGSLSQTESYAP
jgi:hypothetical protein